MWKWTIKCIIRQILNHAGHHQFHITVECRYNAIQCQHDIEYITAVTEVEYKSQLNLHTIVKVDQRRDSDDDFRSPNLYYWSMTIYNLAEAVQHVAAWHSPTLQLATDNGNHSDPSYDR